MELLYIIIGIVVLFGLYVLFAAEKDTAKYFTHTVKKGDTLRNIAKAYHTSISEICVLNDIEEPNKINVGQVLKVRKIGE